MMKNRGLANTFSRNMLIFPYSQLRSNRLSAQQTRLSYVYQIKETDWNLRQPRQLVNDARLSTGGAEVPKLPVL